MCVPRLSFLETTLNSSELTWHSRSRVQAISPLSWCHSILRTHTHMKTWIQMSAFFSNALRDFQAAPRKRCSQHCAEVEWVTYSGHIMGNFSSESFFKKGIWRSLWPVSLDLGEITKNFFSGNNDKCSPFYSAAEFLSHLNEPGVSSDPSSPFSQYLHGTHCRPALFLGLYMVYFISSSWQP